MKVLDAGEGFYLFSELPGYASWMLENRIDEYVQVQTDLMYAHHVPVIRHIEHLGQEKIREITLESARDFMRYLSRNEAMQQINDSLRRWVNDQLPVIRKSQITAADITMLTYIRGKALKHFIPEYTLEFDRAMGLVEEIDRYLVGSVTSATDIYIYILRNEIEEREHQLLEAQAIARIGSFEWDLRNNAIRNTPELNKIFRLEKMLLLQEFIRNVHPDDQRVLEKAMETAMKTGRFECEYRYLADGVEKHIWSRGVVEFTDDKPVLFRGTVQDITDRKRVEDILLQKTLELERSNENLQQFASVASHDLKEPLRKISIFSDMVITAEADRLSAMSQTHLERVKDSSRRMQKMIEDILSYSQFSGDEILETDLEKLLQEVRELLEFNIREKQAVIESDGLPLANVNPGQMRQVFQNLISNSMKFSKKNIPPHIQFTHRFLSPGKIDHARLKEAGRYLEIRVQDNGIGFDPGYADQIFGLFSRLHSRSAYEGTGLGLSITRKIIEVHGGVITASSIPGEGSVFVIILPAT